MITNYNALDLGRYLEIDKVLQEPLEEIDKQVKIIAILADKTTDEVLHLPLAEYTAMAQHASFLATHCTPIQVSGGIVEAGTLHLVPTKDFTKITTAQYVDFQTFVKDFPASLPELLSCFLIPEGKTYNEGYDIAEVQRAVEGVSLPYALGLAAFFFNSFLASITGSLTFLENESRKDPRKAAKLKALKEEAEKTLSLVGIGLQM